VDDETRFSLKDVSKQPLVDLIPVSRIPKNGKLVWRFKGFHLSDVLADLSDRSGIRRKGIEKEKEEKNQAFLKLDPVKHHPIILKTFFLQFFPGIVYGLTYLPYIIFNKKAIKHEISE
jgi:hypothetical protein